MNPIDLGRGRSFKGLSNYLLHDAAEEEGEKLSTAERVGWTQSHNLNDATADKAWRLMVATATSADALKKAAGETKVGAKNTKPVYHYSITWPEADQPSEALQKTAVAESLKALGLEEHQALAVQHKDGKPHVHVMVNLVNPENGTTPKLSYTHKKLRTWANKFELKHGLQVCEVSRVNEAKRKEGEYPDARRKPRNVYEQEQREGKDRRTAWLRDREDRMAREIQRENKALQARQAAEWAGIKESYYSRRDGLHADKDAAVKQTTADIKASFKPKWAAVFKNNRDRMKQFEKSERSAFLQIFTATTTFMESRRAGASFLKSLAAAGNQAERRAVIEKWNKRDEDALSREVRREISAAIRQVKEGHDVTITGARASFLDQCKELKAEQTAAKAVQREKWREYAERRRAGYQQVTGQKIDHSRLLKQNEGLRQYIGRNREPK